MHFALLGSVAMATVEDASVAPAPYRSQAHALMLDFADRTGLSSSRDARRYLWTDAFAVCNFLALDEPELALRVVERVHATLGRHRPDDERRGWLSGLDAAAGEAHPTLGGLRIGKPLPERPVHEPLDEEREWDRDGQYFHYLTRWMHALDQVARSTGRSLFHEWSCELATVAFRRFTYAPHAGGRRRMYWKMSIDLSRPAVPSMGHHDPLDGLVTSAQLGLDRLAGDYEAMLEPGLATDDPLGIGGLLVDAARVAQLVRQGAVALEHLIAPLVAAARVGLRRYASRPRLAPAWRLAFRELGLATGLAAVPLIAEVAHGPAIDELAEHAPLRDELEATWLDAAARRSTTYREHQDINDVMLATALVPEGFLVLRDR